MNLYEYEAKILFAKYGIPVPRGGIAATAEQAQDIAKEFGNPVVIKAQVLVAGRGKAGGIVIAENPQETLHCSKKLIGSAIKGFNVKKILVEDKIEIEKELYLGITVDRTACKYVLLASSEGGIDIEELTLKHPGKIVRLQINPFFGIRDFEALFLAKSLTDTAGVIPKLSSIIKSFCRILIDYDCELIESNPLALTKANDVVAADARIIIDDNALFRHPEFTKDRVNEVTDAEALAWKSNLSYVEIGGNIGVIANGAGLTMATLDLISTLGGNPANFLDIAANSAEGVKEAIEIQLIHPKVKGVLINVVAGLARCDEIAKGLVGAMEEIGPVKPIVVRMIGTNELEGSRILKEAGITCFDNLERAITEIIKKVKQV